MATIIRKLGGISPYSGETSNAPYQDLLVDLTAQKPSFKSGRVYEPIDPLPPPSPPPEPTTYSMIGTSANDVMAYDFKRYTVINGNGGEDLLTLKNTPFSVGIDLSRGIYWATTPKTSYVSNGSIVNITRVSGTDFSDVLIGNDKNNAFFGGDGNDILYGKDGQDLLQGGKGKDTLDGGVGYDWVSYADTYIDINSLPTPFSSPTGAILFSGPAQNSAGIKINLTTGKVSGGDAEGDILISIENILGSAGNDQLTGNASRNILFGGAGSDLIYAVANSTSGLSGNDFTGDELYGGDGNDSLYSASERDHLYGGSGADFFSGKGLVDYSKASSSIYGGVWVDLQIGIGHNGEAEGDRYSGILKIAGTDLGDFLVGNAEVNHLYGRGGNDALAGGDGVDYLFGDEGNDLLLGGNGDDQLSGDKGNDILIGGDGVDNLWGGEGNDLLSGDGFDILVGGAGADKFSGGSNAQARGDLVDYSNSTVGTGITVNLQTGIGYHGEAEGDSYENIRNVSGTAYNDLLLGNDQGNNLSGNKGRDTLYGFGGNDYLYGGEGNDGIFGGDGADFLSGGADSDFLDGGAGDDHLYANQPYYQYQYEYYDRPDSGRDTLNGGIGNDRLRSYYGNNLLLGGAGNDEIHSDAGLATMVGGQGADSFYDKLSLSLVDYSGQYDAVVSQTGIIIDLAKGTGRGGDAEGDRFFDIQRISGSQHADQISGNDSVNTLFGNDGDDKLLGLGGNDSLIGGRGNDLLSGGQGFDILTGNDGADIFAIKLNEGPDRITDFQTGVDKIDLRSNNLKFSDLFFKEDQFNTVTIGVSNKELAYFSNIHAADFKSTDFLL